MPTTPTIPDQRQKEEIAKKIISRFTRIAASACAIAGLVAVTGCGAEVGGGVTRTTTTTTGTENLTGSTTCGTTTVTRAETVGVRPGARTR